MLGICGEDLDTLTAEAAAAARRRSNRNLHESLEDPVQRLCNAMEPETYVRPHRHPEPERWELFVVLRGAASVLRFDGSGTLQERLELAPESACHVAEIPPQHWHTVVAREPGTVLFEVKPGPYRPLDDKDFAGWAPAEGTAAAGAFLERLRTAAAGESVVVPEAGA